MKWSIHSQGWTKFRNHVVCGVAVACLVGACSSEGSDLLSLYSIARQSLSGGSRRVTLQEAAAVPYSSMGVRLGNGPETMIILASDTEGNQLWTSAAKIAIVTRNGRIVRTAGFEHNLAGYVSDGGTLDVNGEQTVRMLADFPDLGLYSVPIECKDRSAGDEVITILGKRIRTRRVDESCAAIGNSLDWSFRNTYWTDPDNSLVWRSIQHVHPDLDTIETEILRPPLESGMD